MIVPTLLPGQRKHFGCHDASVTMQQQSYFLWPQLLAIEWPSKRLAVIMER